jgi:hypothetical protein
MLCQQLAPCPPELLLRPDGHLPHPNLSSVKVIFCGGFSLSDLIFLPWHATVMEIAQHHGFSWLKRGRCLMKWAVIIVLVTSILWTVLAARKGSAYYQRSEYARYVAEARGSYETASSQSADGEEGKAIMAECVVYRDSALDGLRQELAHKGHWNRVLQMGWGGQDGKKPRTYDPIVLIFK